MHKRVYMSRLQTNGAVVVVVVVVVVVAGMQRYFDMQKYYLATMPLNIDMQPYCSVDADNNYSMSFLHRRNGRVHKK